MSGNRSAKEFKPSATTGNRAQPFIQPSLKVGQPGDRYEKEADQMADQIMMKGKAQRDTESSFFPPVSSVQLKTHTASNDIFDAAIPSVQEKSEEEETAFQTKPEADLQNDSGQATEIAAKNVSPDIQNKTEPEDLLQKEEEEESVQPKEMLQKSADLPDELNEDVLQTKSDQPGDVSNIESKLSSTSGGGSSLDTTTKSDMEAGFGADFSGVKVHTGSDAVQMSENLNAQAFTHGNDIYFNEGKYNPGSPSGKHLLAHELTHTLQQGASIQTRMIQKEEGEGDAVEPEMQLTTGVADETAQTITFDKIGIPGFKLLDHRGALYSSKAPLKRKRNYVRGNTNQREGVWKQEVSTETISTRLNTLYEEHHHAPPDSSTVHVFQANITGRSVKPLFIGSMETILPALTAPTWGKDKEFRSFDVDHIVELQLANWSEAQWPNTMENMELLDSSKNRSSGSSIKQSIDQKLESFRELHSDQVPGSAEQIKNTYTLVFNSAESSGRDEAITENEFWTRRQIETGEHLDAIEAGNLADIGQEGEVRIFPNESGGLGKTFRWTGADDRVRNTEATWLGNPFRIVSKQFNTQGEGVENTPNLGTVSVNIPENDDTWQPWPEDKIFNVIRFPGSKYAGYLTKQSITSGLYGLRIKKASPVEILELELRPNGLHVYGIINPSIPVFEGNPIEFRLDGGVLEVSKTFPLDQINVPPPFQISDSSLTIFANTETGLGLRGSTDFGINHVGEGHIEASASTSGGLELEGSFNFDTQLFDPAEINVEYRENTWTIGGTIGIPQGKVRGIKSATITATYSENNFSASGDVELDIPGIEQGTMAVEYGEEGFSISGEFNLNSDIPGIQSGTVSARVAKEDGAENYDVMVSGTAQPDIPGIDSSLSVTYENGAISIGGSAAYERGMLSGNVRVGATNRAIGEDGQPTGEPDDTMRVYGGGDLTLQLTPWLEATAGVEFLPNGEMEVSGRIALPSTVDVFDRREFRRNLFTVPTVEIPIFAIPLGPRSIGLVAQISGGLDFSAGFGPGQLREVYAEVTYNPDHEDETEIHGHGEFAIPADAGLTLRGDLGLGVSVAIASLSGGIELAGTLGLEGEASAAVDLSWSPQTGVILDAEGRIMVNPKFTFDVNAFARASLGIGWFSISETWRHNLVSFSWGPDIQFGVVFPVHYEEDQPFDISFDDIEVIYPDLDVVNMAKGLARDIKDDIFD
ncbi:eCIS core domain-containing protein [Maribellus sediminis]|uniref:eCIS core domain-containing protein n=1 Tax=Maribellus sediminis TaxID=2696285 RepID=UPI001431A968|nr:DUF4157 domain-containing protein [Maribellus sediminis]